MSMSKKHYIALAKEIAAHNHEAFSNKFNAEHVKSLMNWLVEMNPNFDRERFVEFIEKEEGKLYAAEHQKEQKKVKAKNVEINEREQQKLLDIFGAVWNEIGCEVEENASQSLIVELILDAGRPEQMFDRMKHFNEDAVAHVAIEKFKQMPYAQMKRIANKVRW